MALNAAYFNLPVHPRFIGGEDSGSDGGDGGDGGGGDLRKALFTVLPAVYDNAGVAVPVAYVSQAFGTLEAAFLSAGYAVEPGFLVNIDGLATSWPLVASSAPSGPPPIGVAEFFDNLTKDGTTNVSRWLVRLGP